MFFLEALGRISFRRPLAFLGLWPLSPSSKSEVAGSVFFTLLPSSIFKYPCDYIRPTQIIQDDLPILRSADLQP